MSKHSPVQKPLCTVHCWQSTNWLTQ